jgi:hypothetical protein
MLLMNAMEAWYRKTASVLSIAASPGQTITTSGAVLAMRVSIALKRFAAGWAGEVVDSLFPDSFRMLRPPTHTAPVRTEPLFLRAWRVMELIPTIAANLAFCLLALRYGSRTKTVSSAIGLYCVLRRPNGSGNRSIAFALLP